MAEFFDSVVSPDNSIDGMSNMGKPIPVFRKEEGYKFCKSIGLDQDKSMACVSAVAEQLQRDKPYEAMQLGMKYIDLTGVYRLFAILLVEPKPRIRIKMGR